MYIAGAIRFYNDKEYIDGYIQVINIFENNDSFKAEAVVQVENNTTWDQLEKTDSVMFNHVAFGGCSVVTLPTSIHLTTIYEDTALITILSDEDIASSIKYDTRLSMDLEKEFKSSLEDGYVAKREAEDREIMRRANEIIKE